MKSIALLTFALCALAVTAAVANDAARARRPVLPPLGVVGRRRARWRSDGRTVTLWLAPMTGIAPRAPLAFSRAS